MKNFEGLEKKRKKKKKVDTEAEAEIEDENEDEEEIEVYNKLLKYEGGNYKTKLKKKFERRII